MKTIFRKASMALLIAVCTAVFSGFRAAHAAPAMDETNGVYADDFADVSGVANFTSTEINGGAVKLVNGGTEIAPNYAASGTATLGVVQPLRIAKWNTLSIVASTPPGTTIKAQIYDDNNHLFRDIYLPGNAVGVSSFPVDLSAVPILQCADAYFPGDQDPADYMSCNHPGKAIVKFTLATSDPSVTPSLDSFSVTWTLSQGDLSPSTFATADWAAVAHDQQGTFRTPASNPAVYPAFRWVGDKYEGDAEGDHLVVSGGKLFAVLGFAHSRFVALNTDTGNELWQTPNGPYGDPYGVISADGTFYGHDYSVDKSYAIDMATGQIKWSYNFYGGHGSEGVVMGADGTIFVIRNANNPNYSPFLIHAFNPDGTIKWTSTYTPPYADGYAYGISNPSLAADGTIYFSYFVVVVDEESPYGFNYFDNGRLVAVNPDDGAIKWDYQTGDIFGEAAPVVGDDGTIYVSKNFNAISLNLDIEVIAVNPDGTLKWRKNFGDRDWGFVNLALKDDGNLYGLLSADNFNGNGDLTVMELDKTDGSALWSAPAAKSSKLADMPMPAMNFLTSDGADGLFYVDASVADPAANFIRLNYMDADHDMRWQIPYAYDSADGKVLYSFASQVMDDRGWIYSVLGKVVRDGAGEYVHGEQFAQPFALAPWTLAPSTDKSTYYDGETAHFTVTTSMLQQNPLNNGDNKLQLVFDNGVKVPLVFSSSDGSGNTVWTADYTPPPDFGSGTHTYTVEASADMVKTDITTHFDSPASGNGNTGLTVAGSFSFVRHAPAPWVPPADNGEAAPSGGSGSSVISDNPAPSPAAPSAAATAVPAPASYAIADELAASPTINSDLSLEEYPGVPACQGGTLIKSVSSPAVYYCGADGKRYVFPNANAYFSWYNDFSSVLTVEDGVLASIPLGGNVTYRPGTRLVKIQTDPKVYAVSKGGVLRWVSSEAKAKELYGADWAKKVEDVPDSFFVNYTFGQDL